jgi:predicted metal-dependent phosphoesterase TrpH
MADPSRATGATRSALNADLHCHSVVSDGTLTPEALVERAHRNGVELLALTDHDELAGLAPAAARASALGLPFVPGVEVSISWGGETIHVVGLRIDWRDPVLAAGLAATRSGRDERAREMADQLAAAGVPNAYEGACRYVGNPELISRSHFARYIVETGLCASVDQVFDRFLVEGKPGFVPHRWASMTDAVGWIRGAGGHAVMAHPGRYTRLGELAMEQLLREFCDAGGSALEVVSGSHSPGQVQEWAATALRLGLAASRGSDFHSPVESRHDLGSVASLPAALRPVWQDWPEALMREPR